MTWASAVERDRRMIQIGPVQAALPAGMDELQDEARAEGERLRFVDRLADEWATGNNRFALEGEVLPTMPGRSARRPLSHASGRRDVGRE